MNYRSVVAFGPATPVADDKEKLRALSLIIEHMVPGRWDEARPPTGEELRAKRVTRLDIEEASAKVRDQGPGDEVEDLALTHIWAGHVPLVTMPGDPIPDQIAPVPGVLAPSVIRWLDNYPAVASGKGSGTVSQPERADS